MLLEDYELNAENKRILKFYKNEMDYTCQIDQKVPEMIKFVNQNYRPYCTFNTFWWLFGIIYFLIISWAPFKLLIKESSLIFYILIGAELIVLITIVTLRYFVTKNPFKFLRSKTVHYYEKTDRINYLVFPVMIINLFFVLFIIVIILIFEFNLNSEYMTIYVLNAFLVYLVILHKIIRPADLSDPIGTLLDVETIEIIVDYFDFTNIFSISNILLEMQSNLIHFSFILCILWIFSIFYKFLCYFGKLYPYNYDSLLNSLIISKMQLSHDSKEDKKFRFYFCFRNRVRFLISSNILDILCLIFRIIVLIKVTASHKVEYYGFLFFSIKNCVSLFKGVMSASQAKKVIENSEECLRGGSIISVNQESPFSSGNLLRNCTYNSDDEYNLENTKLIKNKTYVLKQYSMLNFTSKFIYIFTQVITQGIFCSFIQKEEYKFWFYIFIIFFCIEMIFCFFSFKLYKKTVELPDNGISCFFMILSNCFPIMSLYFKMYFLFLMQSDIRFKDIKYLELPPKQIFCFTLILSYIFTVFTGKLNCWWMCLSRSAEYFITKKKYDLNWSLFLFLIDSLFFESILDILGCMNLINQFPYMDYPDSGFYNYVFAVIENFNSYLSICTICFLYYFFNKNYIKYRKLYLHLRVFLLITNSFLFIWRLYLLIYLNVNDYFIYKNALQIIMSIGFIENHIRNQINDEN